MAVDRRDPTRPNTSGHRRRATDFQEPGPPVRIGDIERETGFSRTKILSEVKAGELPAMQTDHGAHRYFRRSDVRAWLTRLGFLRSDSTESLQSR